MLKRVTAIAHSAHTRYCPCCLDEQCILGRKLRVQSFPTESCSVADCGFQSITKLTGTEYLINPGTALEVRIAKERAGWPQGRDSRGRELRKGTTSRHVVLDPSVSNSGFRV